jgi:hypothetical protein
MGKLLKICNVNLALKDFINLITTQPNAKNVSKIVFVWVKIIFKSCLDIGERQNILKKYSPVLFLNHALVE